tara:strand:- start:76470 stop:76793 length:324 start_codon:yes stop_codon:yes gene_type:complete
MEISRKPLAAPYTKSAPISTKYPGARKGRIAVAQINKIPYQVALPTPIWFMILEASGITVKFPRERKKMASPKLALSKDSSSRTKGIWIAQVPKRILRLAKAHAGPK